MDWQREAAKALIHAARGQVGDAREAAIRVLEFEQIETGWIPGHPQVGVAPHGENPVSNRLREIAAGMQ